jgi:hypothetical protein
MFLGFLFIRPMTLPEQASRQSLEDAVENDCHTPLLNDDSMQVTYTRTSIDTSDGEHSNSVGGAVEATHSVQVSPEKCTNMPLNVHGKALLRNLDFWLLFCIYSMRMSSFSKLF